MNDATEAVTPVDVQPGESANGEVGYVVFNRHASHMFRYEVRLQRNGGEPGQWGIATDISGTGTSGIFEPVG